jgi:hypothetical protein
MVDSPQDYAYGHSSVPFRFVKRTGAPRWSQTVRDGRAMAHLCGKRRPLVGMATVAMTTRRIWMGANGC